jgi:hypothetical protein
VQSIKTRWNKPELYWKLTSVDVGVLLHVRLLVKPFATILTRIRPRVGMDQQMRRQSRAALKRFPALFAREGLLIIVNSSERRKNWLDLLIYNDKCRLLKPAPLIWFELDESEQVADRCLLSKAEVKAGNAEDIAWDS